MQIFLIIWFSLTAVSVAYVAYDLFTNTPAMKVMKWGWIMVTLYTGIVGLVVYILSCREPAPGTHEKFVAPLWKQAVGSTIHCMAGDATGVIVVAFITALLNLPMRVDSVLEYVAGFAFGLFIFQSLFMKNMLGVSYLEAVRKTWYPEWLSMNFVMAGMIPVMIILMTGDVQNMDVASLRFWGIMSLASITGGVLAVPINWWMVKNKLKHGMGTERALGKGGAKVSTSMQMDGMERAGMTMPAMIVEKGKEHAGKRMPAVKNSVNEESKMSMHMDSRVSVQKKVWMAAVSIMVLGIGIAAAGYWGDFSMRPEDNRTMEMNHKM